MLRFILRTIRQWWAELEMRGRLPSRIGRHRVIDTLQQWDDRILKFSAGASLGTRKKMVRLPDVPPADSFSGNMDEQARQAK